MFKRRKVSFIAGAAVVMLLLAVFFGCETDTGGGGDPTDNPTGNPTGNPTDDPAKVATPTANPPTGVVQSGTAITLSTSVAGASIRYTTDGTDPTAATGTVYADNNKPATTTATIIKAIAYKDGMAASDILTA